MCIRDSRFPSLSPSTPEQDALSRLGKDIPNLAVATLIGGVPVADNVKTLEGGCHIAVGTPGRVKFLIDKGVLLPETARTLVLESADWLIAPVFLVSDVWCCVVWCGVCFFMGLVVLRWAFLVVGGVCFFMGLVVLRWAFLVVGGGHRCVWWWWWCFGVG